MTSSVIRHTRTYIAATVAAVFVSTCEVSVFVEERSDHSALCKSPLIAALLIRSLKRSLSKGDFISLGSRLNASAEAWRPRGPPDRPQPGHDVMGWKIGRNGCAKIPLGFDHHAWGFLASPISLVRTMWFETGRAVITAAIHRTICGE